MTEIPRFARDFGSGLPLLHPATRKPRVPGTPDSLTPAKRLNFKSPMTAPGLYPEHDLFIQLMKLKNTLRHLRGEELITHLGLEYYD